MVCASLSDFSDLLYQHHFSWPTHVLTVDMMADRAEVESIETMVLSVTPDGNLGIGLSS
jgi:hypothetical protein